jgi:recombination protein RecA
VDSTVKGLIASINKKHGPGTVVLGSEITRPFLIRIPSGSLSLDVALGGGWPTNHWNEVVGQESAGKTFLVLKTIAANQKRDPKWTVVWFAAEDFVESYARMAGCDLDRIVVIDENTMETVYESAEQFIDSKAVDCLVIDSLPALVPKREEVGSMEDLQPGLAAFLTGKFLRKTGSGMKRTVTGPDERPVAGFIINQWRDKIGGYGDPRTTPGGKAKNFFYFTRVEVRRDEWIKNTKDEPIGQVLKVVNVKNKQAPPGRIAYIDAYFSAGNGFQAGEFDVVKDTVAAGIAYGLIEREGAYFSFEGNRWHGRAEMTASIRSDEDLQHKISAAVLSATGVEEKPKRPRKKTARRG